MAPERERRREAAPRQGEPAAPEEPQAVEPPPEPAPADAARREEVLDRLQQNVTPPAPARPPVAPAGNRHKRHGHGGHHTSAFGRVWGPIRGVFGVLFSHLWHGLRDSAKEGFGWGKGGGGGGGGHGGGGSGGGHH